MRRAQSLGLGHLALGLSVAVHAAAFVATTGSRGTASASVAEPVSIELLADPETPPPVSADAPTTTPSTRQEPTVRANRRASGLSAHEALARPAQSPAPSPAVPSSASPDVEAPRFAMAIRAGIDATSAVEGPPTKSPGRESAPPPLSADAVDVRARLERGIPPTYPSRARAAGVEGDVVIDIVVDPKGTVESARVVRGVGFGLDEAAVHAISDFRFAPARLKGQPVRVRMLWPMRFRLD